MKNTTVSAVPEPKTAVPEPKTAVPEPVEGQKNPLFLENSYRTTCYITIRIWIFRKKS